MNYKLPQNLILAISWRARNDFLLKNDTVKTLCRKSVSFPYNLPNLFISLVPADKIHK